MKLVSFSYRDGGKPAADFIVDCRGLPNPHNSTLRPLNGRDLMVQDYVMQNARSKELFAKVIERLQTEQRVLRRINLDKFSNNLVVAAGCIGGRHRSVAFIETLAAYMREYGVDVEVVHTALAKRKGRH